MWNLQTSTSQSAWARHPPPQHSTGRCGVVGSLSLGCRIKLIEKVVSRSMYWCDERGGREGWPCHAGYRWHYSNCWIVSPRLLEIVHFIAQPQCGHCQPVRSTSSRCLHHGNYRDFSTHRERGREAETGNIYRIVFNYLRDLATFKHTVWYSPVQTMNV